MVSACSNLRNANAVAVAITVFAILSCGSQRAVVVSAEKEQYLISPTRTFDPSVDAFIVPYRDSLDKMVDKVLAVSEAPLTIGRGGGEIQPAQVAMGNFVTDAALEIAKQKAKELNQPVPSISFFTWGSLRKSLPAGEITLRNMFETMPFENEMVVLKLSGVQLISLLEQLSKNLNPISGVSMKVGDSTSILINDSPIQDDKFYHVLASDYHAFGGDNLTILQEASEQYLSGIKVRDAFVLYLQQLTEAKQTLKPDYEARIRK